MGDETRLPFPLPRGVKPPLGIRVAAIEDETGQAEAPWYVEFHYPDYGKGTRWGAGASTHSPDFPTEAEAATVAQNIAEAWRCPVQPTVVHPRGRTAADVARVPAEASAA